VKKGPIGRNISGINSHQNLVHPKHTYNNFLDGGLLGVGVKSHQVL
jgi:hypothetical protein